MNTPNTEKEFTERSDKYYFWPDGTWFMAEPLLPIDRLEKHKGKYAIAYLPKDLDYSDITAEIKEMIYLMEDK